MIRQGCLPGGMTPLPAKGGRQPDSLEMDPRISPALPN